MTSAIGIQLRKEGRALLPWWLCVAAATIAAITLAYQLEVGQLALRRDVRTLAAVVHSLGVLALAALSVGHELTHGTLASLLVQPSSRLRLLLVKLAVLVPAVVSLGLVTASFPPLCCSQFRVPSEFLTWAPVAASIGLVPLLTLLTGKPLGGIVFAIAIPGLVFVIGEWIYVPQHSIEAWWLAWYGTLLASSLGLFALLRLFPRLEVSGGTGSAHAPHANAASEQGTAARRSWWWLAARKEVRLQYHTLSMSGLYVIACVLIIVAQRMDPDYTGPSFYGVTALHAGVVALLAGAMSSAEERHLGTLPSQILMPRSASRQWAVKVGVTMGLSVALAVGLPAVLVFLDRPADRFIIQGEFVLGVLLATSGAMYVSSLSSNSLWALLASLPAFGLAVVLTGALTMPTIRAIRAWIPVDHRRISEVLRAEFETGAWRARSEYLRRIRWLERDSDVWITAVVALVALWFAFRNHRSLDRSVRTIATQVIALLLVFWTGTIACLAIARLSYGAIR